MVIEFYYMKIDQSEEVLVTGGSGFIASYCIAALLQQGYRVKTTLRSLSRIPDVKQMLSVAGISSFEKLSFAQADLFSEKGWVEAVAGCSYVIHPASPTPQPEAKKEDDFVIPAVNGVLYVLRAAKAAGVKRVVLTSAFGAICYGTHKKTPYDENDWSDLNAGLPFYQKSKTLSEQAAWNYVKHEGKGMELSVINPVVVLGPVLGADYSHSIRMIYQMLNGAIKGLPQLRFGYVDVRDVADLHVIAMQHPLAAGERFLAVAAEAMSMLDIANILHNELGDKAAKVPRRELPSWLIRIIGLFNPSVRFVIPHLGMVKEASHEKATRLLNWHPRGNKEAVLATAESLIRLGLVK